MSTRKNPNEPSRRNAPSPKQVELFLRSLSITGRVKESATAAGLRYSTVYRLRATDEDFADDWDESLYEYQDRLEAEIERRAVEGYDEPVFHQGEVCGYKRRFSDQLLLAIAKRHIPEYREPTNKIEVGSGGVIAMVSPPTGENPKDIEDEWRRKFRASSSPVAVPRAPE